MYTSMVMSMDELPTKSTVAAQVTSDPTGILSKVHPLDARSYRAAAGMANRRDRSSLVHQRHQLAAKQIAPHILHVRHDEGRDLANRV